MRKGVLKNFTQFTGKHFYEISKNNFSTEHLWATASDPTQTISSNFNPLLGNARGNVSQQGVFHGALSDHKKVRY